MFLLAAFALAAIALLASGLGRVSFRAGQIMGEREAESVSLPVLRLVEEIDKVPVWKQLLAWAIVFLIVVIASSILSPEFRRRVITAFLRFTVILAALYFVARNFGYLFARLSLNAGQVGSVQPEAAAGGPPPVFEPPQMSPILTILVSVLLAIALAASIWAIGRWWQRRRTFLALRRPMGDLADIARKSLDELSAGRAWDDVIVESYVRMARVVEKRQGLTREIAMTPSEFARRLETAGLPADAIQTLTRLFESVRYGARRSTSHEIDQAVTCLTAILNYCGEPA